MEIQKRKENEMMRGRFAIHGDVTLIQVNGIPEDAKAQPKDTRLANGEHTGNYHIPVRTDKCTIYETPEGKMYLRVEAATEIFHQEHDHKFNSIVRERDKRMLPKGDYEVIIAREYDPLEEIIRQVRD